MVMTEKCLDNITNYANTENAVTLPNDLTAVYTYDYCADAQTLSVYDMTELKPLEAITALKVTVKDAGGTVTATVAATQHTIDVSGLALGGVIRIEYEVETDQERQNAAPAVFINVTKDEETRGVSDPNRVPLREKTTQGGVYGQALIYEHIQAVASTTWTVPHNFGIDYPASIQLFDASDNIMITGWVPVDSNTIQFTFGSAKAGRAYLIFKKP
jgi:hypothetical protein